MFKIISKIADPIKTSSDSFLIKMYMRVKSDDNGKFFIKKITGSFYLEILIRIILLTHPFTFEIIIKNKLLSTHKCQFFSMSVKKRK